MCSVIFPKTDIVSTTEGPVETSGQDEEPKTKKRKISLSNCSVCGLHEAKYKCPGCLVHSCSLPCVKKHKADSSCSGIRNKTAFVALSQFDEMALLSDYRFLEDTGRFADGATRDSLVQTPRTTSKAKQAVSLCQKDEHHPEVPSCLLHQEQGKFHFFPDKRENISVAPKACFPSEQHRVQPEEGF
uniref:Box C/D snoRNA protein 1 n=1 Tax=Tetraodon nigroviridis TaxID=99883 RepID=H3C6D8_TETNG